MYFLTSGGMLYPRDSESRETKELSGMWSFRTSGSDQDAGFREQWYSKPLSQTGPVIPMPVPASYNDITQDAAIRDYVGWVWYDREFFAPTRWRTDDLRVVLRFGSAHYYTIVWVNGQRAVSHDGGHLPFEADVGHLLSDGRRGNRVTVAINNTLSPFTLPTGSIEYKNDTNMYPPGYFVQNLNFDFFNYAGIHRTVLLYTTPATYIDDITVVTDVRDAVGVVRYNLTLGGRDLNPSATCKVVIRDKEGTAIAKSAGVQGEVKVADAILWWPFTMHPQPGYMYTFEARCAAGQEGVEDVYRLPFGIRTVNVTKSEFLINGRPFYFMGFGKHEDANIRGKGLDYALIAKDFNLIRWLGANSFRTSHYPYAEEIMDQADRQGVVVIDEVPAVGLHKENFAKQTLQHHLVVIEELIRRDKNRPSVVMWSIANEPSSNLAVSNDYFKAVAERARSLDVSRRPLTIALSSAAAKDVAHQHLDVVMVNRYFGWYSDPGRAQLIGRQLLACIEEWRNVSGKPVMVSEYGADTIAGMHMDPPYVFTEEYQVQLIGEYHKAFDVLRKKGYFVGELIWNFADFMTAQTITRVVGNKKGILTRDRQPKASAHVIRRRYHQLVNSSLDDCAIYW
ncbi:PREDICTED: beta-glucuronidase-like isoform X2 [Priapulus caudatus]|uniref:Beta-glucuronidase n=1 Tax=Priapulus caudatus TaxID=37621 RepID=A0ABM1F5H9_PRICU|nr:PREDICTED: beta-glucuronidase-like isoform X2 [Priapulus caudatus]